MTPKILVIGTGGVGSIVALALHSTKKCEVSIIVRSIYDQVSEHGFDFDSCDYGKIEGWKPDHIFKDTEEAKANGPFDYILVSTKNIPEVQKTEDVVRPLVVPGTCIVLIQNGIGGEEQLMEAFPDNYILGGISLVGSANYNGKILHNLPDHESFGTYDKRPEAQEALKQLCDIYGSSKSQCELIENLKYRRWCKLIYNACINTTTAVTGLDCGRMYFSGIREAVVYPAMKEVRAIAEADLQEKLPEGIEKMMAESDNGVYFKPSMLVDVEKGQPIELQAILGNPLRIAKKLGVEAPTLTMLYKLLSGIQFSALERRGIYKIPAEPFSNDDSPLASALI